MYVLNGDGYRGNLWVTRSDDAIDPARIDLLDRAGRYLGTVDARGVPAAFPTDSTLVALSVDRETAETMLTLYRIASPRIHATAESVQNGSPKPR